MTIIEDVNQKLGKHVEKNTYWNENNIKVIRNKLPFGDYCAIPKIVIDTKRNVDEIAYDISADHIRFKDSLILAKQCGSRFIVLIENDKHINCVEDVAGWINPRLVEWYKLRELKNQGKPIRKRISKYPPIDGKRLCEAMKTLAERYNVEWMFCRPSEAGKIVIELLTKENENGVPKLD